MLHFSYWLYTYAFFSLLRQWYHWIACKMRTYQFVKLLTHFRINWKSDFFKTFCFFSSADLQWNQFWNLQWNIKIIIRSLSDRRFYSSWPKRDHPVDIAFDTSAVSLMQFFDAWCLGAIHRTSCGIKQLKIFDSPIQLSLI